MFISLLRLDPRSGRVRRDLANFYELHRTLMRAFPGRPPGGPGRVLFRLEPGREGGAVALLVQSEQAPDWSALPPAYLAAPAESKPFAPAFGAGQRLCFRLRANPAKKVGTTSKADRLAGEPRHNGRRVGLVREADQLAWLRRKGEAGGFRLHGVVVAAEGLTRGAKPDGETFLALPLFAARFDGLLEVTDPARFLQTLRKGVGPAKSLGFGLLSVARPEG
jgi:CRISPR system Cascade subunit CasE